MRGVVVVHGLGREDREQAHQAGGVLVLAAQAEERVEEALVVVDRARDALGVVLVAQFEQLEEQVLLGREVVQELVGGWRRAAPASE